jgi:hypothetical protein
MIKIAFPKKTGQAVPHNDGFKINGTKFLLGHITQTRINR